MSKKKIIGQCSLCLKENCKLSEEHVPPQKAFNNRQVFLKKVDPNSYQKLKWKKPELYQNGVKNYTLCEKCNNNTGSWYGNAYVDYAYGCSEYLVNSKEFVKVNVNLSKIYPLRVLKQILTMFCSKCGPGFSMKNPWIRGFILDKNQRLIRDNSFRLLTYLCAYDYINRSTGMPSILTNSSIKIISEFNWWPLGFVLVFDRTSYPFLTDITWWESYTYEDCRDLQQGLYVLPMSTAFPLDFRTQNQLESDREKSKIYL